MWYVFFLFFAQKADLLKVKHRSLSPSSIFLVSDTLSDDVKGKKNPAPRFIQSVRELLKEHDAVIADKYVVLILFLYYQSLTLWYSRNNHTRQHRDQLREIAQTSNPPIHLLAWYWSTRQPPSTIHRVMSDRIIARRENHPVLVGDAVTRSHEDVLRMFLNQVEELEEDEVDEIVEIGVEDSLEELLEKDIEGCVQVLGMERPSKEEVEALGAVREY